MEYKQKFLEENSCSKIAESEMASLTEIVNKHFNENILRKSRRVNLVNARMVFSKILRERGYTLSQIGRFLSKDHSTIVNYMSNFSTYLHQDRHLRESYMICAEELSRHHKPKETVNVEDLMKEVLSLRSEISQIKYREDKIRKTELRYSRLSEIINLIESRTPIGQEEKIKSRVERMFNE